MGVRSVQSHGPGAWLNVLLIIFRKDSALSFSTGTANCVAYPVKGRERLSNLHKATLLGSGRAWLKAWGPDENTLVPRVNLTFKLNTKQKRNSTQCWAH